MILMRGDAANIYFQWKARHSEDSATMNLYDSFLSLLAKHRFISNCEFCD